MRRWTPIYETVYGSYGSDLYREFVVRSYPDPNEAGSPGTLATLTGATFTAEIRSGFDELFLIDDEPFDLGDYVAVAGTGLVSISIPQATLEKMPVGTHRYKVAMKLGSAPLTPLRAGAFVIDGPSQNATFLTVTGTTPNVIDGGDA
jgi:hypothetical protein